LPIQEVACDRDVRASRLLPSTAQLLSKHGVRRSVGVVTLVSIDAGCLVLAVILVSPATGMGWTPLWPDLHWWDVTLACASIVVVSTLKGLYGRRYARHDARKILSAWGIALLAALVTMVVVDPVAIGARYVVAWLFGGLLALCGRFAYDAALAAVFGPEGDAPPALLLGSAEGCKTALRTLSALPPHGRVRVMGFVVGERELREAERSIEAPGIVATTERLRQALVETGAVDVILADPASLNGHLQDIIDTCQRSGVTLKVVSPGLNVGGGPVTHIPGLDRPLFVVRPRPAGAGSYIAKRAADRIGAAVLLLLLSPVLLAIALLIRATSRGPALFVEQRIGVGQRPFDCYKFRTMVDDARAQQRDLEDLNEAGDVLFKMRADPRVTPVGRFLRRLSLDELPQLLNVLKGDMSLVGPRPLPLRDCALMADWHLGRHVMLPGITGLWQVSGRSDLSFEDMVRLDLRYIETWSFKTDVYIVWRSIGAVLRSRGAY
jgi:exopolysaccharide biosynthesis polyprenyl glycosylphosphotransferase